MLQNLPKSPGEVKNNNNNNNNENNPTPRPHSIPIQAEFLGWEQASKFVLNIPGDSKAQLSLGTNSLVSLWHTVDLNAFCFFSGLTHRARNDREASVTENNLLRIILVKRGKFGSRVHIPSQRFSLGQKAAASSSANGRGHPAPPCLFWTAFSVLLAQRARPPSR